MCFIICRLIICQFHHVQKAELFTCRCGQLDGEQKEVSPIFTQFLECVWQLMEQFPQVCGSVILLTASDVSCSVLCYLMLSLS